MRFFLDHDVDAAVGRAQRGAGHECWSAAEAGLNEVSDDELTIYAQDRGAILITHDKEFSQRRRRNVAGHHLQLRCTEWEAADVLLTHLDEIRPLFEARTDLFVVLSLEGFQASSGWK